MEVVAFHFRNRSLIKQASITARECSARMSTQKDPNCKCFAPLTLGPASGELVSTEGIVVVIGARYEI